MFYVNLFEMFMIGRDINAKDSIVHLIFSTLWHLWIFFRNIRMGWLLQINVDATYRNWRIFNFIRHVNNHVCWTVIPETESRGGLLSPKPTARGVLPEVQIFLDVLCEITEMYRFLL
jgi:hypothetical protein